MYVPVSPSQHLSFLFVLVFFFSDLFTLCKSVFFFFFFPLSLSLDICIIEIDQTNKKLFIERNMSGGRR